MNLFVLFCFFVCFFFTCPLLTTKKQNNTISRIRCLFLAHYRLMSRGGHFVPGDLKSFVQRTRLAVHKLSLLRQNGRRVTKVYSVEHLIRYLIVTHVSNQGNLQYSRTRDFHGLPPRSLQRPGPYIPGQCYGYLYKTFLKGKIQIPFSQLSLKRCCCC